MTEYLGVLTPHAAFLWHPAKGSMHRLILSIPLFLIIVAVVSRTEAAPATQPVGHAQKLEATRTAKGEITLKVVLTEIASDGTTTLKSSTVNLNEGTRAELVSGSAATPGASDVWTGTKIEVVSALGRKSLCVLTTISEKGKVVWAEAADIDAD